MDTKNKPIRFMLDILLPCLVFKISFSLGADTISVSDVISRYSTLVSEGGIFEMGLFQPGRTPNYYLGIWYRKDPSLRAVWVANREKPASLSSVLKISDGNLVLFDESNIPIWSTNVKNSTTSYSVQAVLFDTGNLVLNEVSNSLNPLWQSFDNPSHAWLPGAKLGYNKVTKTSKVLTSWKNSEDPAPGLFSHEFDPSAISFSIMWNRSKSYWTSGSWDGKIFSNVPEMRIKYIYVFSLESNDKEIYLTYTLKNTSAVTCYFEMGVSGQFNQLNWLPTENRWIVFWTLPTQKCDVFALCGVFGSCSEKSLCDCLPGFKPKLQSEWDLKDYSSGCVRKEKLQCGHDTLTIGERDRFLEMPSMSMPDNKQPLEAESIAECESKCLNICSCTAYVYDSIGCSIWTGDLLNLKKLGDDDGTRMTLDVRLAASVYRTLKGSSQKQKLYILLFGSIATAMIIFCTACFTFHLRRKKLANKRDLLDNRRNILENQAVSSYDSERHITQFIHSNQFREDEKKNIHVPFVALEAILAATDNFLEANKLGQGGFGPVYKGNFLGGQEIAVKRLSSGSEQGLQEFKNEVLLIAKLQHRNLVKLLGYCVEGDEKILLYEYMPNNSLDSFLFDQQICVSLSWEIRFNVILGIARGLHYLHHDSRLRIIHRDLKTSNILLDEEMNPKISDFGLARIFGGKQIEANTIRVVGTYGYMSPEYALEGLFSIKSDVFSFGVVLLEILSGKRNTRFCRSKVAFSLVGYAWKLWTENKALDLMDATLHETCNANEFLRCVCVGLLCIQEDPIDRPNMSNVLSLLGSENASLPSPKQPAYAVRRSLSNGEFSSDKLLTSNELTDTLNEGR